MIKFACCSFNYIGFNLEQSLRTIRGMGIHHADIGVMGADAYVNQLQAATIVAELLERQWEGVISMECIWPVDTPVLTRHPTIQNALMAHVFERAIADLEGRSLLD